MFIIYLEVFIASSSIHLAISKTFLLNNPGKNYNSLLAGTLFPDTVNNKDISHYTDLNRGKDNISHLRGKVNLYNFLRSRQEILTDFVFGWFIHLVTDYLFFDECFSEEYLLTHTYQEFRQDLYFAYDHLNSFIYRKYNILITDYEAFPLKYHEGLLEYQNCIFTKEMIVNFIEKVTSIDFDEYIIKIKLYKKNVKPY